MLMKAVVVANEVVVVVDVGDAIVVAVAAVVVINFVFYSFLW